VSSLAQKDSEFLLYLRSLSILVIVLGHIGLFWAFEPYSEFLHVFIPIFFFISGAVAYDSYKRSHGILFYYKKRVIGLLVTYYLLCCIQLVSYLWVNKNWDGLGFDIFVRWFFLSPDNSIMSFSIGHVWFLHTLFVIIILSPLYFHLFDAKRIWFYMLVTIFLLVSFLQLFVDVSNLMIPCHQNLFKPAVHSSFFLFGALYFHSDFNLQKNNILILFIFAFLVCISLLGLPQVDIDIAPHLYAPDLYYVSASFIATSMVVFLKNELIYLVKLFRLKTVFFFLHRHTLSIYLIHVPIIALWFSFFAVEGAEEKNLRYGMQKMIFVLAGTIFFSVPFTYVFSYIVKKVSGFLKSNA